MKTIFRKWRVETVRQGSRAPIFFVETHAEIRQYAEKDARRLVEEKSVLVKLGWNYILTEV